MITKSLAFYNLILAATLAFFGFANSPTSQETIYALSFAPMILFFGLVTFRRQSKTASAETATILYPRLNEPLSVKHLPPTKEAGIADIDKRGFLKLIGVAGLSFFLSSVFFSRKDGTPFFGSATGPKITSLKNSDGIDIDPAERQPTDGYSISEIDDNNNHDTIAFYGFTDQNGAWYVMKKDEDTGSIRYSKGNKEFPNNWANRENLNYDYFNNVF